MNMERWQIVPDVQELLTTLRLMEELHRVAASYSAGETREEHILLSQSYREAIEYIQRLHEQGMILPF